MLVILIVFLREMNIRKRHLRVLYIKYKSRKYWVYRQKISKCYNKTSRKMIQLKVIVRQKLLAQH